MVTHLLVKPTSQAPRRAARLAATLVVLAAAVGLSACQAPPEAEKRGAIMVETIVASKADYSTETALTGEVQAEFSADLAFQIGGQVAERLVDVGDHVSAGQVLARVGSAEQTADRDAAQAQLLAAQSQFKQSTADLERQKSLLSQGLVARSAYDRAVEILATSSSAVDSAQAALDGAEEALGHTELRAFADGTVTALKVEPSQVVQPGQYAFTVANDGAREAVFDVDEGVLTERFAAQTFAVRLFERPEITAAAVLNEIAPTIDKATGSVKVKLKMASPPSEMTLGSVVATTAQYQVTSAIVLPASALTSSDGKPAVWVVAPDTSAVSLRLVTLDRFDAQSLVITGGVEPGERIVTAGASLVYPQQIVAFKE
ncbi:efflux RND transporter periplasmic adaptor subunit [Devosia sp. FKR38]|uniref:efflux RND transporter periplasmic adaptor subunit n=1 Tax=Devosia sp. FKR38 TaxID=2562312 RepID=UPI001485A250|nr:efflux RND transporter periplasmic adaptor subunit [Devosia sp. FKR38]